MDGLRADDQGVHIQHAIESRNNVENRAPDGEGKIEPQELGHKAHYTQNLRNFPNSCRGTYTIGGVVLQLTTFLMIPKMAGDLDSVQIRL